MIEGHIKLSGTNNISARGDGKGKMIRSGCLWTPHLPLLAITHVKKFELMFGPLGEVIWPFEYQVIEYIGEIVRPVIADRREKLIYDTLVFMQGEGTYMFQMTGERVLDATRKGNIAQLINHSCEMSRLFEQPSSFHLSEFNLIARLCELEIYKAMICLEIVGREVY